MNRKNTYICVLIILYNYMYSVIQKMEIIHL